MEAVGLEHEITDTVVEVLECNEQAVTVYMYCNWNVISTMAGAWYTGIPRGEIVAVCQALGIAQEQMPDILWGVSIMESAARPILNDR